MSSLSALETFVVNEHICHVLDLSCLLIEHRMAGVLHLREEVGLRQLSGYDADERIVEGGGYESLLVGRQLRQHVVLRVLSGPLVGVMGIGRYHLYYIIIPISPY